MPGPERFPVAAAVPGRGGGSAVGPGRAGPGLQEAAGPVPQRPRADPRWCLAVAGPRLRMAAAGAAGQEKQLAPTLLSFFIYNPKLGPKEGEVPGAVEPRGAGKVRRSVRARGRAAAGRAPDNSGGAAALPARGRPIPRGVRVPAGPGRLSPPGLSLLQPERNCNRSCCRQQGVCCRWGTGPSAAVLLIL